MLKAIVLGCMVLLFPTTLIFERGHMERVALVLLIALVSCSGCVATTGGRTGGDVAAPPMAAQASGVTGSTESPFTSAAGVTPSSSPAAAPAAVTISGIEAQDEGDHVVIQVTGDSPFQNQTFQRLGSQQFSMEITGVRKEGFQAPISNRSSRLKYLYIEDAKEAGTVRLVGGLSVPIKEHAVLSPHNCLVLNLYTMAGASDDSSRTAPKAAMAPMPKPKPLKSASARSRAAGPAATPSGGDAMVDETNPEAMKTKQYTGKPISLDLQDADIRNVLRLLADVSGMNLVVEPDVTGKVTLKVEKVPWDQVLDMVLLMNSLDKQQSGTVVRIAHRTKLEAEYREHNEKLKVQRDLAETTLYTGEISTVQFTLNYADITSFQEIIKKMMSDKGKVSTDARTNSVIYSDYPYFINNARHMLARLDRPKPQVLIEARIVRVNTSHDWQVGFDWEWLSGDSRGSSFIEGFDVSVPVSATATMGFTLGKVAGRYLDVELSALETTGEGKVISAPRVLTLDGVEAVISQGSEVPYLTLSDSGTTSTAFRKAVLELKVKPHITPDGKVRMEIHAKKEEPDYSTLVGSESQPAINTREIATELIIDNGNTVVIGGVIEDSDSISRDQTPGLSKIPLVGNLFTANKSTGEKTELLIFITPRVVAVDSPDEGMDSSTAPTGAHGS